MARNGEEKKNCTERSDAKSFKIKAARLPSVPQAAVAQVHRPDLQVDTSENEARFQVGHEVEEIARRLYDPNGSGAVVDVQAEGFDPALARSVALLDLSAPVFEAGFAAEGALAFADILLPSARSPSTPGAWWKLSPRPALRTIIVTTLPYRRS